jgi:hypothetical protein
MRLYGPRQSESPEDYEARRAGLLMREIWKVAPALAERLDPEYEHCPKNCHPLAEDYK